MRLGGNDNGSFAVTETPHDEVSQRLCQITFAVVELNEVIMLVGMARVGWGSQRFLRDIR